MQRTSFLSGFFLHFCVITASRVHLCGFFCDRCDYCHGHCGFFVCMKSTLLSPPFVWDKFARVNHWLEYIIVSERPLLTQRRQTMFLPLRSNIWGPCACPSFLLYSPAEIHNSSKIPNAFLTCLLCRDCVHPISWG